jgi:putative transposase
VIRRSLTRTGFLIGDVQYYCDTLKPWIARRDQLGRFVLRRDPRDISRVWALDPDGSAYLEVPYRTLSRPPISAWEQAAAAARPREAGRADVDESALFAMVEQMRQVTDSAGAARRKATASRAARGGRRGGKTLSDHAAEQAGRRGRAPPAGGPGQRRPPRDRP